MKKLLFLIALFPLLVNGQMSGSLAADDYDAYQLFSTASISTTVSRDALDILGKSFKVYGLWSKMKAIYPIVGGTSTTCKYNMKDVRDLDAAFRLTFTGSITFASTGMLGDGSTGYADTHLVPNTDLTLDDSHMSFYSRSNNDPAGATYEMGDADLGLNAFMDLYLSNGGTFLTLATQYNVSTDRISTTTANSVGLYVSDRTSSTSFNLYKNGSSIANTSATRTGALGVNSIYILNLNYAGGSTFYSQKECDFATIGSGLTSTQISNMYTIVSNFNTTLSR